MTLKEHILWLFENYFKGKRNAIKRNRLKEGLFVYSGDLTDREMRTAYEDLPICGSSKGLYLPETKAEIDEQIKLHWSKIYSYFRKVDVLENYHIESDAVQKDLF